MPGDPVLTFSGSKGEFVVRVRFPCIVDAMVAHAGESLSLGTVLVRVQMDRADEQADNHYGDIDRV